jgi:cardiolipin synthase
MFGLALAMLNVTWPESIGYGTVLHIVLSALICLHLLRKPRDARTSLLWIFFATAFPVIGPLVYLLFGINTIPRKGWEKQHSDVSFQKQQQQQVRSIHPLAEMQAEKNALRVTADDTPFFHFDRILEHLSPNHPLLGGNDVQLIEPAELALEEMFLAIRSAQRHIHLATYIFNDDAVGYRLMDLLEERARAGEYRG